MTKGQPKKAMGVKVGPWRRASSAAKQSLPVFLVLAASVVVLVGLAALPARTWLEQKQATADASTGLEQVEAEVSELELKLRVLQTDDEVERMGRENFDLVFPGEESYRILPAPQD